MADEPEQEEAPKKSGMLGAILLPALIGFVAGGLGFATIAFVPSMLAGSEEQEEVVPPVFHDFGEVVSNLDEGELSRYLRVKLTLQIDGSKQEDLVAKLEEQKSVLKSWLNSYFSSKQLVDVRGAEGQNALRREIQNKFNSVVATDGFEDIQDVLFEEFQIQ
jgi:flagellar basal body-associated protein FliL